MEREEITPPLPADLVAVITAAPFVYLATVSSAGALLPTPHLSLMCFTPVFDSAVLPKFSVVFTTRKDTLKFSSLQSTPDVALLLTDSGSSIGVTMYGKAQVASGAQESPLRALHMARNPSYSQFILGDDYAVVVVPIESVRVSDQSDAVKSYIAGGAGGAAQAASAAAREGGASQPLRIALGTKNKTKQEAVELGFKAAQRWAPAELSLEAFTVPSGVSVQPMTDEETRRGALIRALRAREKWCWEHRDASGPDFALGVEGGCAEGYDGELTCFAWVCVVPRDEHTAPSFARSAVFALPPAMAALVRGGMELGLADDQVSGRQGSKHKDGAVGLVTQGAITRATYYATAVTLALAPFLPGNEELYPPPKK